MMRILAIVALAGLFQQFSEAARVSGYTSLVSDSHAAECWKNTEKEKCKAAKCFWRPKMEQKLKCAAATAANCKGQPQDGCWNSRDICAWNFTGKWEESCIPNPNAKSWWDKAKEQVKDAKCWYKFWEDGCEEAKYITVSAMALVLIGLCCCACCCCFCLTR